MPQFDPLRLLILFGLVSALVAGIGLINLRYRKTPVNTKSIQGFAVNKPSIILFTSPNCPPCDKVQKPILNRLMENAREKLQYFEIDTITNPEIAAEWGVLSVPSTFLLNREGIPQFVHHGVVSERILLEQIKELS